VGWRDRNPMSYRSGVITDRGIAIRPAVTDADLIAWNDIRRIVMPNKSVPTIELLRAEERPDTLMLLAESGDDVIAMQRVNVGLGYVPRSVSRTMRRNLP
jgi:hypothetical protein